MDIFILVFCAYRTISTIKHDETQGIYHFCKLEVVAGIFSTQFYALYKQATAGPCNIAKPGFWDVTGRAKWYSKQL